MKAVRSPIRVTYSVWKALFLREAVTRFSNRRAGWVWLLLEPLAHVAILMTIFSFRRQKGWEFALFLGIGVVGFTVFRSAAQRGMRAIAANAALFQYRQGKPVDAVLVRAFLEGMIEVFVALVLLGLISLFGLSVIPHDPLQVLAAWILLWLFGTGLGLIFSVGATLIPEVGTVFDMLLFPLYMLSGVMFLPIMMPPEIRPWLLINPVLHGLEFLRAPFFPDYLIVPGASLGYLGAFTLGALFLGLALHIRFARKLVTQ